MYGHKSALVPSLTGTSRWRATASVAVTREPAARALRVYTPACGFVARAALSCPACPRLRRCLCQAFSLCLLYKHETPL